MRGELTKSRAAANAQGIALATGTATGSSLEARLADTEQRFEDARTLYQAESRKLRDELKWRSLAEDRIGVSPTPTCADRPQPTSKPSSRPPDARSRILKRPAHETLRTYLAMPRRGSVPCTRR